jgi:hypothetical protein
MVLLILTLSLSHHLPYAAGYNAKKSMLLTFKIDHPDPEMEAKWKSKVQL